MVRLDGFPECEGGAPLPVVLSSEHRLILAYYCQNTPPGWDGTTVRVQGYDTDGQPIGVVDFQWPYHHMFGPPNEEAIFGHPLASRGIHPYGVFEVKDSSWIRALERMNSVHRAHKPEAFKGLRHLILTFHDSVFECVARGYDITTTAGSLEALVPTLAGKLTEKPPWPPRNPWVKPY
ncbi:MAG: hypothetical protein LC623_05265 [Halobacteriales archaeon]|nr:hypothetical protein [Halobacteriales archaeon]